MPLARNTVIRAEPQNTRHGLLFWRPLPRRARGEAEAAGAVGGSGTALFRLPAGRGARSAPCTTRPAQSQGWLGPRPLLRLEEGAASACQQLHFLETKKTEGRES